MDEIPSVTRKLIADRIDDVLSERIGLRDFGNEMFFHLANANDKYEYEKGYVELIQDVLKEFMDLHDAEKGDVGYIVEIPSKDRFVELKNISLGNTK